MTRLLGLNLDITDHEVETRALPTEIDAADDLSRYTTDQLRVMNNYLEPELIRLADVESASMSEAAKRKWFAAVEFLNRVGAELLRRSKLPPSGPRGVCYECMPDGSSPVRMSFTILAF